MAKGGTNLAGYIFIVVALVVIGFVVYMAFFAPGEYYKAHVTVINNATSGGFHTSVYIGEDIYDPSDDAKKISLQYYMSPGQVKTYDLNTKFLGNTTPRWGFDVVDGHNLVASNYYYPQKKVSNVTLEWTGKTLRIVSSS